MEVDAMELQKVINHVFKKGLLQIITNCKQYNLFLQFLQNWNSKDFQWNHVVPW